MEDVHLALADVPAFAQRAERLGYDGLLVPEAVSDGVLVAALALEHTKRLRVGTGVVVAFARSPMLLAQDAWSLARMSGGRFELGLGSQVRGNVVRRYGMPWSAPAARMRDYVGALRAIFRCWQHGEELDYKSESYTLNRMQPFFRPGPIDHPDIPIALGAVGPWMTRVAGETADALITHPTNASPAYLRDVVRPHVDAGARVAGRDPSAVHIVANPMSATGATVEAVEAEREEARRVLAFTLTTPAYRASLEHAGRLELHQELLRRSRAGEWDNIERLIPDDLLDELCPTAPFDEIAATLRERYEAVADTITLRMPHDPVHDRRFAAIITELRAAAEPSALSTR